MNTAQIYKIYSNLGPKIYIGSTKKKLCTRLAEHRAFYKRFKNGFNSGFYSSFDLFNEYGIENCKIELIENINYDEKYQLLKAEGGYIKQLQSINKTINVGLSPDEIKEKNKKKYAENAELIKAKYREYYRKIGHLKKKEAYYNKKEQQQKEKEQKEEEQKEEISV